MGLSASVRVRLYGQLGDPLIFEVLDLDVQTGQPKVDVFGQFEIKKGSPLTTRRYYL
jgi:hypothetical protein